MGVKGLWKLLEPTGRPVTLESLENKVLGVDTSLLLNQSVKGIRDKEGNAVPNAHLVGLFHRVCKLLFYRIKPVFVFDGGVPHLKKQTLAERRERRIKAMHGSSKAAERILKNYLKGKALEAVTGKKSCATVWSTSPREPDLFELPPLTQEAASQESSSDEEELESSAVEQMQLQSFETGFAMPGGINVESADFQALTPEIQHELIMDMKQEGKHSSLTAMPQRANSFSNFQLEGVLKRGRLNLRLEELRKEMASRNTGQVSGLASQDSLLEESTVESQRIASEDTGHYILIKKGEAQAEEQEESQKDSSMDGGFIPEDTDYQILSRKPNLTKQNFLASPPLFEIPDSEESSDEENFGDGRIRKVAGKNARDLSAQHPDEDAVTRLGGEPEEEGQVKEVNVKRQEDKDNCMDVEESEVVTDGVDETPMKSHNAAATTEQSTPWEDVEVGVMHTDYRTSSGDFVSSVGMSAVEKNVDEPNKQELHVPRKILIDLTEENFANIDDVVVLGSLGGQASRNRKRGTSEGLVIDLTDDDADMRPFGATKNEQAREGQPCGSSADAKGGELLIDLTADENDGANADEERSKSEAGDRVQACLDLRKQVADPVTVTGVAEKGLVSDNRIPDSIPEVEESAPTNVGTQEDSASEEVRPVASTSAAQYIGEKKEKGNTIHELGAPSAKGAVRTPQGDERASSLLGRVQEPTSTIPQEWLGATKEDLEVIQQDLAARQHELAEEQARQNRMAATVSSDMTTESQELLRLFGVPYLVSPMEAEAQCAALDLSGLTDGSITDDSDVFLFGGRTVYKNVFNQTKHAELYLSDTVQRSLGVDRSKLICLAYITGSDYTDGIQGIGIVGAMEVLLEFPGDGLEGLKQFKKWHEADQQQEEKPVRETKVKKKLRSTVLSKGFPSEQVYDAYANPVVNNSMEKFEWGKPDLHGLRLFALDKLGWSRSKTDELLLPVLKELNKNENQLKLDKFFQVQFKEARKIQSKRIRRVVNRFSHPSTDQDGVECDEGENLVENSVRGKKKGEGAKTTSPTSKKLERTVSTKRSKGRKVGAATSSSLGEEKSNVSTPRGCVEEATEATSILQNKGEKVATRESKRASGRTSSIPQDSETNPEQRLDDSGTGGDGDTAHDERKEKKGSRKQKRNPERPSADMEQGPSERTRSGANSQSVRGLKRNTAFAKLSDETLTSTSDRGITIKRRSTSPQCVAPTTGRRSNKTHNHTRGHCRGVTRGQTKKRLLTSPGATERDSTSSDSEGSDDNRYTGPQPECVLKRESARSRRPTKHQGRVRGTKRTRV